ncbi:acyl-CoA dehydrogenase [Massilia forsythiae]|uniref:acyl-CoA dehydrogenase n=1 Tax=Massilia forsythiae TaxID=2728020 RepID=UPI001E5BB2B8|nr:acyl-CoA dehydrogenase [Massilia forsythiae]
MPNDLLPFASSDGADACSRLQGHLHGLRGLDAGAALRRLVEAGADRLPLPGQGRTLERWRALAAVGARDLSLAKLFEGHTDALAILAEAGMDGLARPGSTWGTWCAEPPDARVLLQAGPDGGFVLAGRKAWCSGAQHMSHAVLSCWNAAGEAMLAAVEMRQPGVRVTDDGWNAIGMQGSGSVDVQFDGARATPLGESGFYVRRPGFWHGGAGVAAVWYGAATALAEALRRRLAGQADAHRLAQLGEVTVALQGSAALLRESAAAIDAAPHDNAMLAAVSVRLSVEAAATTALAAVGRALGPGPMCKDPAMARLFADLPVFLRQSHAERDQETVGRVVGQGPADDAADDVANVRRAPWTL